MKATYTLQDARKEKYAVDAKLFAKDDAAQAEKGRIAGILKDHPEIGVLNSGKFYVYPVGGEYREAKDPVDLIES
jgi:hypothetical protein